MNGNARFYQCSAGKRAIGARDAVFPGAAKLGGHPTVLRHLSSLPVFESALYFAFSAFLAADLARFASSASSTFFSTIDTEPPAFSIAALAEPVA